MIRFIEKRISLEELKNILRVELLDHPQFKSVPIEKHKLLIDKLSQLLPTAINLLNREFIEVSDIVPTTLGSSSQIKDKSLIPGYTYIFIKIANNYFIFEDIESKRISKVKLLDILGAITSKKIVGVKR